MLRRFLFWFLFISYIATIILYLSLRVYFFLEILGAFFLLMLEKKKVFGIGMVKLNFCANSFISGYCVRYQ